MGSNRATVDWTQETGVRSAVQWHHQ